LAEADSCEEKQNCSRAVGKKIESGQIEKVDRGMLKVEKRKNDDGGGD